MAILSLLFEQDAYGLSAGNIEVKCELLDRSMG